MEYSNPKIPEEINYTKENHFKEFIYLALGISGSLVVFVASVYLFAQTFAHYIPFKYEKYIFPDTFEFSDIIKTKDQDQYTEKKQHYLTTLAKNLASNMDLPADMQIQVNYIDADIINAGATLNGQILIYQGLLDFVESENELAMVIAHEIAHVKARHPIKALSSGVIVGLSMAIVGGSIDNGGAAAILNSTSTLTSLNFSRKQESEADELALEALYAYYGHTKGSYDFFERMQKESNTTLNLQILSTHPSSKKRISRIKDLAKQFSSNNISNNKLTDLPSL